MLGVGATSINAYMAQQAIADRHQKGLFKNLTYEQCVERYINTVKNGILKIMSKMGISVVSSYRGGCNFEARWTQQKFNGRIFSYNDFAYLRNWTSRLRKEEH